MSAQLIREAFQYAYDINPKANEGTILELANEYIYDNTSDRRYKLQVKSITFGTRPSATVEYRREQYHLYHEYSTKQYIIEED